jgi:hypothetical protein
MAAPPGQQRPGAELASRRILIDPVRWRSAVAASYAGTVEGPD